MGTGDFRKSPVPIEGMITYFYQKIKIYNFTLWKTYGMIVAVEKCGKYCGKPVDKPVDFMEGGYGFFE